jgi:DNA invertase Pin-like site-specific DNA recombinase
LQVVIGRQSGEVQHVALGNGFDREFMDDAVSGAVPAADRTGFGELLAYVGDGDLVLVYAVDRLGHEPSNPFERRQISVEILGGLDALLRRKAVWSSTATLVGGGCW